MKTYTNEERLDALNRHNINLTNLNGKKEGFTVLTQWIGFKSIEEFADNILRNEDYLKAYNITDINHFDCTELSKKRKEIYLKEGRILTPEETQEAENKDIEYNKLLIKLAENRNTDKL